MACEKSSNPDVGFFRFETATINIQLLSDGVLDGYKDIVVSIHQKYGAKVDKNSQKLSVDVEKSEIDVYLTQNETSKFNTGKATIQVNVFYEDHERDVSAQGEINVYPNLYERVMS